MLVIRQGQLHAFRAHWRVGFVEFAASHLAAVFPASVAGLAPVQLADRIETTMCRAEREFGLRSQRDLLRFLNLAAAHGWDFDARPENQWMRDMLLDPDISDNSARLHRLIVQSIANERIQRQNDMLSAEFLPADLFESLRAFESLHTTPDTSADPFGILLDQAPPGDGHNG